MTQQGIDRLRGLHGAATPEPRGVNSDHFGQPYHVTAVHPANHPHRPCMPYVLAEMNGHMDRYAEDCALIIETRNALPALLDDVEKLKKELADTKAAAQADILAFYTAAEKIDVCACDYCANGTRQDIDCAAECFDRTGHFVWRGNVGQTQQERVCGCERAVGNLHNNDTVRIEEGVMGWQSEHKQGRSITIQPLPGIRYCPWCGGRLPEPADKQPAKAAADYADQDTLMPMA